MIEILKKQAVRLSIPDHVIGLQFSIDEMKAVNEGLQKKLAYFENLFCQNQKLSDKPIPVFSRTLIPCLSDAIHHLTVHMNSLSTTSNDSSDSVITIETDSSSNSDQ